MKGLLPKYITLLLREFIANQGGKLQQVPETRDDYRESWRFYYKVIVPVDLFKHGLFVDIVLRDEDPEAPAIWIVNAHEQKR